MIDIGIPRENAANRRCVLREKCASQQPRRRWHGEARYPMAVAELTLLGGFELRLASGEVIDLPGQKDRALLAVLALRPGSSFSREKLAGLLWSDRGDAQARDSLKHSLSRLRQLFAFTTAQPVIADRHSVRFDASEVGVDVALFEQLSGDGTTAAWERAARLYRGDFLDGIAVRDPAFDDWLDVERQRLRQEAHRLGDEHPRVGGGVDGLEGPGRLSEPLPKQLPVRT